MLIGVDCCICNDDDFDVCFSCFDAGKRCHDANHVLKVYFLGDTHYSFPQFSPWVAEKKTPKVPDPVVVAGEENAVEETTAEEATTAKVVEDRTSEEKKAAEEPDTAEVTKDRTSKETKTIEETGVAVG